MPLVEAGKRRAPRADRWILRHSSADAVEAGSIVDRFGEACTEQRPTCRARSGASAGPGRRGRSNCRVSDLISEGAGVVDLQVLLRVEQRSRPESRGSDASTTLRPVPLVPMYSSSTSVLCGQRLLQRESPGLRVSQLVIRVDGISVGDGRGRDREAVLDRKRVLKAGADGAGLREWRLRGHAATRSGCKTSR